MGEIKKSSHHQPKHIFQILIEFSLQTNIERAHLVWLYSTYDNFSFEPDNFVYCSYLILSLVQTLVLLKEQVD